MKNLKFSNMENLNLYGDNDIQMSVFFAVLSLKMCITDKQFSAPVIGTGKVKTGCHMSYRRKKHQNPEGALPYKPISGYHFSV